MEGPLKTSLCWRVTLPKWWLKKRLQTQSSHMLWSVLTALLYLRFSCVQWSNLVILVVRYALMIWCFHSSFSFQSKLDATPTLAEMRVPALQWNMASSVLVPLGTKAFIVKVWCTGIFLVLFYIYPIVPYAPAFLHSFLLLVTVVKGIGLKR